MGSYTLGIYKPSYLNMRINMPVDFSNLKKIKRKVKAVYFHEYIHFLQDISTTFGLSNMWNTYDRIRQIISVVQKGESDLVIPLKNPEVEKQLNYFKALKAVKGDFRINHLFVDKGDFVVKNVIVEKHDDVEKVLVNGDGHLLKLVLQNSSGDDCNYMFGAEAVSESMAYLMEQKLYRGATEKTYPYCSAKQLALYVCKRIAYNNEFLFSICDIALMSGFPGISFYNILLEIEQQNFQPTNAKELYSFGIDALAKRGWDIFKEFDRCKNGLMHVFNEIYSYSEFEPTRKWFNTIINEAFNIRTKEPYYPVYLYQDKPYGPFWETIVAKLGFPEMHNSNDQRWFASPLSLRGIEDKIHPIFLLAFWQLHDLLLTGQTKCKLIPFCAESNQKEMVDELCRKAPWKKVNNEKLCSYCALWKFFGLDKKNVILSNT